MDVSRRRTGLKASVVAGSVWETRMKSFNGDGILDHQIPDTSRKPLLKRSPTAVSGKRKTWKSESFDGTIQIAKPRFDSSTSSIKNSEEQSRELSVSADGIKRASITGRRAGGGRSENGSEKIPIQGSKGRSDDGNDKNSIQILRKSRSDVKEVVESAAPQLRKVNSDSVSSPNQSGKDISIDYGIEESNPVIEDTGIENNPQQIEENGSEESCKEFGVFQEQIISDEEDAAIDEDDDDDEETEIEIEVEKKSVDIVEIKLPEAKSAEEKPKKVEISKPNNKTEIPEVKVHQFRNRTAPTSSTFKQPPPPAPVMRRAEIYENLSKATKPTPTSIPEYQNFQERHSKLQNLVDLIMWRDISRSAFVFGIGTFIIISSSYTKDLNVSFISVISYLGLLYLAAIFLYRSLIFRGVIDVNDTIHVFGEEEAIWLVKLFLPYLNESLLRIKALFSGDPATTMKMAVLLFVFARCGSSITIWKMAKLGFFGVFIVPKVCSSYSKQLTGYAKFWIRRFRDAWDSCTHKKAVALAIFSLVWNLSSMLARVWAVFMMFVAVRYYQQSMESDDWVDVEPEDEAAAAGEDDSLQGQNGGQREGGPRPTPLQINKLKKGS
ncbi:reticulon-like protein B21 isoform X2 [Euphorbia lathyris]|uniref:reticulon-like protein B21 isoform X2 n=1 Tax=Euphorbia lathyris TaxID=212925 RepID=UPI00331395E3